MKKIILLFKKEGETPLEALKTFRGENPEYERVSLTYAGRLDPMASGLLLVLAGEKTKEKEKYLALPKEYEFSVLFCFSTDTFDILGKVKESSKKDFEKEELRKLILENLKYFTGKFKQKYPLYSSRTVKGKPLFSYARSGEKVKIPEREVSIEKLEFLKMRKVSGEKLLENIEKRVRKVKGDFRQEEILKIWRKKLSGGKKNFFVADFKIKCGSGTYVRGIADSLGERIGVPALAYSIKRTRIGKWYKI